jgi:hypothetical protein
MFLFIPAWLAEQLGTSHAIQSLLGISGVMGIPFVWYFTGRWIDARLGYLPETHVRPLGGKRRTAAWIMLVTIILTLASLLTMLAVDCVRDEDVWLSGVLWGIFISWVLVNKLPH